ncbi:hypothetical protein [Pandoravirus japonicus]|uniref:Uncharacterized protein n=1 Tax=Pandoravirus japonicus TaxID=2823154 RepID=A0A811BN55_9VIRU|nr:hypothetical protein [Pandoravirus japonicus]
MATLSFFLHSGRSAWVFFFSLGLVVHRWSRASRARPRVPGFLSDRWGPQYRRAIGTKEMPGFFLPFLESRWPYLVWSTTDKGKLDDRHKKERHRRRSQISRASKKQDKTLARMQVACPRRHHPVFFSSFSVR